jgi:DNA-binding MarR family transcriptional regulator
MNESQWDILDKLGKKLSFLIGITSIAKDLEIKISPKTLEDDLLECKNLINRLKCKIVLEK